MPPVLLCWPAVLEVDVGGMAVEAEPSITCCCCVTDSSRGTVWQNGADMEVCMKQRYGIVLLCEQKMAPSDIHQCLLNVCGDWTVDVSSVRWWVVTATRSRWPCTPVAPQNEEWLGLFVCANWWITTRELSVDLDICFSALERMVATLEYHKFCSRWVPWTCDVVSPCWAGVKMMVHRVARMWIPHWLKSLRCCPQWVNWCTLTFGIGKGDPSGFPGISTNHQLWPLCSSADWTEVLNFQCQVRKKKAFLLQPNNARHHTNWKTGACCQSWLGCPLESNVWFVFGTFWLWNLSWWKMDCVGNVFLAMMPS